MTVPPALFKDLQVTYGDHVVLHGISASVQAGQCVAVTGSNGSGKSTLLKALLGIAPVTGGQVQLFGKSQRSQIPWQQIGYVPQRASAGGGVAATVKEVVQTGLLGPRTFWLPRGAKDKIDQALESVGLLHRRSDAFDVLSGGQQQRVLIARALVRSPELLLLDEPLTGLDQHNREALAQIIAAYKAQDKTTLIVLHELGELASTIDRELHISSGHITYDGQCRRPTRHSHGAAQPHEAPTTGAHETDSTTTETGVLAR